MFWPGRGAHRVPGGYGAARGVSTGPPAKLPLPKKEVLLTTESLHLPFTDFKLMFQKSLHAIKNCINFTVAVNYLTEIVIMMRDTDTHFDALEARLPSLTYEVLPQVIEALLKRPDSDSVATHDTVNQFLSCCIEILVNAWRDVWSEMVRLWNEERDVLAAEQREKDERRRILLVAEREDRKERGLDVLPETVEEEEEGTEGDTSPGSIEEELVVSDLSDDEGTEGAATVPVPVTHQDDVITDLPDLTPSERRTLRRRMKAERDRRLVLLRKRLDYVLIALERIVDPTINFNKRHLLTRRSALLDRPTILELTDSLQAEMEMSQQEQDPADAPLLPTWNGHYDNYVFAVPEKNLSYYLVVNLNRFGRLGGLQFLLERLLPSENEPLRFDTHPLHLSLFKKVIRGLRKDLASELFLAVVESNVRRLLPGVLDDLDDEGAVVADSPKARRRRRTASSAKLKVGRSPRQVHVHPFKYGLSGDDIANIPKKKLDEIIGQLSDLLETGDRARVFKSDRKRVIETLYLETSLRYFHSKTVNRRIEGLVGICDMISRLRRGEKRTFGLFTISTLWITQGFLCEWITTNQIIETVFNDLQEEILRKSKPVLEFVATSNYFSRELLGTCWQLTLKKHEANQQIIFNEVFARNLVPYLEIRHIDYFYEAILDTPVTLLKPHLITFVKQFSVLANKFNSRNPYGFNLLLRVIHDENYRNEDTTNYSLGCLIDLIKLKAFQYKWDVLRGHMIENIMKNTSVPQSLKILEALLVSKPTKFKRTDVTTILDVLFKHIRFLFQESTLELIEREMETKAEQDVAARDVPAEDLTLIRRIVEAPPRVSYVYLSRFSKIELLRSALTFVTFLLKRFTNVSIPVEYCQDLWTAMVGGKIQLEERNCFIDWFMRSKTFFADLPAFFNRVVLKVDSSSLDLKLFILFQNFFIKINQLNRSLLPVKSLRRTIVQHFDTLKGLDKLWEIAVDCETDEVSRLAKNYLNDFHYEVSKDLNLKRIRMIHIDTVFKFLELNQDIPARRVNALKIALDSLLLYLRDTRDGVNVASARHGGVPIEVFVKVYDGTIAARELQRREETGAMPDEDYFVLSFFSKTTFEAFSESVAKSLTYPKHLLRFFHNGEQVTNDRKIMDFEYLNRKYLVVKKLNLKEMAYELLQFNFDAMGLEPVADLFAKAYFSQVFQYSRMLLQPAHVAEEDALKRAKAEELLRLEQERAEAEGEEDEGEGEVDGPSGGDDTVASPEEEGEVADDGVIVVQGGAFQTNRSLRRAARRLKSTSPIDLFSLRFSEIYSLLDGHDVVAMYASSLLSYLPNDKTVIEEIESLENLEELLSSASLFRLQYILRIISNSYLQEPSWRTLFIEKNGVSHLVGILLANGEKFKENMFYLECMAYLLQIVNFFVFRECEAALTEGKVLEIIETAYPALMVDFRKTEIVDPVSEFQSRLSLNAQPKKKKKKKRVRDGDGDGDGDGDDDATKTEENDDETPESRERRVYEPVQLAIGQSLDFFHCAFVKFGENLSDPIFEKEDRFNRLIQKYLSDMEGGRHVSFEMMEGLKKFAEVSVPIKANLLQILFEEIHKDNSPEYFDFVVTLVLMKGPVEGLRRKALEVTEMLVRRPVIEDGTVGSRDEVFVGLIGTLAALLRKGGSTVKAALGPLVMEFFAYIFPVKTEFGLRENGVVLPKCKDGETRNQMFDLLAELCIDCVPNGEVLLSCFASFFAENFREIPDFVPAYRPLGMGRVGAVRGATGTASAGTAGTAASRTGTGTSATKGTGTETKSTVAKKQETVFANDPSWLRKKAGMKFVGLRNQSATCYMNSLLQQLFMTIPFRNDLLKAQMRTRENDNEVFLYELQKVFGFLENSFKKAFMCREFFDANKNYDGQPYRRGEQRDVDEFLFELMDKVEEGLKSSDDALALNRSFKFLVANQFVVEKEVVSEKADACYKVILEVQNKNTLLESLGLYIEGEHMTGENQYFCEKFGKKVDAIKRCRIKTLPPVLLFHLKRFEYKYDLGQHIKYNGRLEYPQTVDMRPYCCKDDSLPDEYYKYRLVGILVHSGGARSGHYYSYIMDRSNRDGKWYEFNDTTVVPWDFESRLELDTFGGESIVSRGGKKQKFEKYHSAYMLFYQRETELFVADFRDVPAPRPPTPPTPTPGQDSDEEKGEEEEEGEVSLTRVELVSADELLACSRSFTDDQLEEQGFAECIRNLVQISTDYCVAHPLKTPIMPKKLYDLVWGDNYKFFCELNVFNKSFDAFLWQLVQVVPAGVTLELILTYMVNILSRAIHHSELDKWKRFLMKKFKTEPNICRQLLDVFRSRSLLFPLIVKCGVPKVKEAYSKLIVKCIKVTSPSVPDQNPENIVSANKATALMHLVRQIAEFSIAEKSFLIEKNAILLTCNVLRLPAEQSRLPLLHAFQRKVIYKAVQLIFLLCRSCKNPSGIPSEESALLDEASLASIVMPKTSHDAVFNYTFLVKILKAGVNLVEFDRFVNHWAWNSLQGSEYFARLAILHLSKAKPKAAFRTALYAKPVDLDKVLMDLFTKIVSLDDDIKADRCCILSGLFMDYALETIKYMEASFRNAQFIAGLASKSSLMREQLRKRRSDLQHICDTHGWNLRFPTGRRRKKATQTSKSGKTPDETTGEGEGEEEEEEEEEGEYTDEEEGEYTDDEEEEGGEYTDEGEEEEGEEGEGEGKGEGEGEDDEAPSAPEEG